MSFSALIRFTAEVNTIGGGLPVKFAAPGQLRLRPPVLTEYPYPQFTVGRRSFVWGRFEVSRSFSLLLASLLVGLEDHPRRIYYSFDASVL
jgi:hypothetical protein